MRALLQRAARACVRVDGRVVGEIGAGLLILVGIKQGDDLQEVQRLSHKVAHLRVFEDKKGKMNLSVVDAGGACLVVSQFTLYGDCTKGRRPYFGLAQDPVRAEYLCDVFAERLKEYGLEVATGMFGAMMDVDLVNHGPVTLMLDTDSI
jgi:D-aminoacyl-tRNA deacylase